MDTPERILKPDGYMDNPERILDPEKIEILYEQLLTRLDPETKNIAEFVAEHSGNGKRQLVWQYSEGSKLIGVALGEDRADQYLDICEKYKEDHPDERIDGDTGQPLSAPGTQFNTFGLACYVHLADPES
jgi:hypothetical protein